MNHNPYLPKPYKIIQVIRETELEYTFRVETDIEPSFGQFVQVSIPRIGEAPISVSGFGKGWLDLTIRRVGNLTNTIHDLRPGDKLFLRGPYGKGFPIDAYKGKHLVIAAGGTGLAPVRSMINYFYENTNEIKKLDLLIGFKNPQSIIFKDDIANWKEKFDIILTVDEACGIWDGECVGLITAYVPNVVLPEPSDLNVVIVGPPVMMKYTAVEFRKRNIPKDRIWVSFERNMSCALGKCGHCKIDETYVCLEGPVFRYDKAEKLID